MNLFDRGKREQRPLPDFVRGSFFEEHLLTKDKLLGKTEIARTLKVDVPRLPADKNLVAFLHLLVEQHEGDSKHVLSDAFKLAGEGEKPLKKWTQADYYYAAHRAVDKDLVKVPPTSKAAFLMHCWRVIAPPERR